MISELARRTAGSLLKYLGHVFCVAESGFIGDIQKGLFGVEHQLGRFLKTEVVEILLKRNAEVVLDQRGDIGSGEMKLFC